MIIIKTHQQETSNSINDNHKKTHQQETRNNSNTNHKNTPTRNQE